MLYLSIEKKPYIAYVSKLLIFDIKWVSHFILYIIISSTNPG